MNLLLWRHAEAEDGTPDLERALTSKGRQQAKEIGHWLKKRLPEDAVVLVSPAVRTRETADALERDYQIEHRLAPGATTGTILSVLAPPQGAPRADTFLLVGHQPWIGETAAMLITGSPQPWSVRKASVWWLVHRSRSHPNDWIVKGVVDADLL